MLLSSHRVPHGHSENIAAEIARERWTGSGFLIVIVIVPPGLIGQILCQLNGQRGQRQVIVIAQWSCGSIGIENQRVSCAAGKCVSRSQTHPLDWSGIEGK